MTALGTVVFTRLSTTPDDVLLSVSPFVWGLGLGFVGVAITAGAYRDISATAISRATSLVSVVQRLGASFGTAAIAAVLATRLPEATTPPGTRQSSSVHGTTFGWVLASTLTAPQSANKRTMNSLSIQSGLPGRARIA